MTQITRDQLHAYLDDALSEQETARVEQTLRGDAALRHQLQQAMQERDRGEHSLGAIWRRERLTCPGRETLQSYILQVLDDGEQQYLDFHLRTVGCPFCLANLADLESRKQEPEPAAKERRTRIFQSSAGLLQPGRES